MRLLLLTNIPAPYRIPLFNRLAKEPGLEFRVVFLAKSEANREWKVPEGEFEFDYRILGGWHLFISRWEVPFHLNAGVIRQILEFRPTAVMSLGYDNLAYWQAAFYCRLRGKKYLIWSGSTLESARQSTGPIGWLKRTIVRLSDGYVAYGTKASECLEYLGARPDRIRVAVNTVDMETYRRRAAAVGDDPGYRQLRARYPELLLMYSGRLAARKGVQTLLEALRRLSDPDIGLMIVGSGPEEDKLKRFVRDERIQNVHFEGFRQTDELSSYYAIADAVVLPTTYDRWGLVVNEALATGAYVLCSDVAGVARDLIRSDWNGATFDPSGPQGLVELIGQTKDMLPALRERRGRISDHACKEFGTERSAQGLLEAVRMVHERR